MYWLPNFCPMSSVPHGSPAASSVARSPLITCAIRSPHSAMIAACARTPSLSTWNDAAVPDPPDPEFDAPPVEGCVAAGPPVHCVG